MVITDNETRWNSTYISIKRGILLYNKIQIFSIDHRDELGDDFLFSEDWDILRRLEQYLELFERITKLLQGYTAEGYYRAIWEALPAMEYLLRHLEKLKS